VAGRVLILAFESASAGMVFFRRPWRGGAFHVSAERPRERHSFPPDAYVRVARRSGHSVSPVKSHGQEMPRYRGRGIRRLSLLAVVSSTLLVTAAASPAERGEAGGRRDAIGEWIRTIREKPRAHSLSPSWNGKSPYEVIGVSALPLQNEVAENADGGGGRSHRRVQPQRHQAAHSTKREDEGDRQLVGSYRNFPSRLNAGAGGGGPVRRRFHGRPRPSSDEEEYFDSDERDFGGDGHRARPASPYSNGGGRRPPVYDDDDDAADFGGDRAPVKHHGGRVVSPPGRPGGYPSRERFRDGGPGPGGGQFGGDGEGFPRDKDSRQRPRRFEEHNGGGQPRNVGRPGEGPPVYYERRRPESYRGRPSPPSSLREEHAYIEEKFPGFEEPESHHRRPPRRRPQERPKLREPEHIPGLELLEGEEILLDERPVSVEDVDGFSEYEVFDSASDEPFPREERPPRGRPHNRPQQKAPQRGPPRQQPRHRFPQLGPNPFQEEEHPEFPRQSFEQAPRAGARPPNGQAFRPRPLARPKRRPGHYKGNAEEDDLDINAGIPAGFSPSEEGRPPRSRRRPSSPGPSSPSRPRFPDSGLNEYRPQRQKVLTRPRLPSGDEIEHGFKPSFRPSRPYQEVYEDLEVYKEEEDFDEEDDDFDDIDAALKLFDEDEGSHHALNDGPIVGLGPEFDDHERFPPNPLRGRPPRRKPTPRPIPTPSPHDFPQPPPRPPRPPPTHPTHPPRITHPPSHYRSQFNPPRVEFFPESAEEDDYVDEYLPRDRDSTEFSSDGFPRESSENPLAHKAKGDGLGSEGFFSMPESFPSLEALGAGFESMKVGRRSGSSSRSRRMKRSAAPDVMRLPEQQRRLLQMRRRRQMRRRQQQLRRQQRQQRGEVGQPRRRGDFAFRDSFWDDVDVDFFEDEFGSRRQPQQRLRQRRPLLQQYVQREYDTKSRRPGTGAHFRGLGIGNYHRQTLGLARPGRHRDPYPQPSIQGYGSDDEEESAPFGRGLFADDRDNEILGSGNFEVIRGGTFYDSDTYLPSRPSYGGGGGGNNGGDFFENFRDFADIKNEAYRYKYDRPRY